MTTPPEQPAQSEPLPPDTAGTVERAAPVEPAGASVASAEDAQPGQEPVPAAAETAQPRHDPLMGRRAFLGALAMIPAAYAAGRFRLPEQAVRFITGRPEMLAPKSYEITIPWIPPTVKRWEPQIAKLSELYQLDADFIAIIMTLESGGGPKAHSPADAKGLMQITPPTEQDIAAKYLKQPRQQYDIWDPETNIEFGAAYLSKLRDVFALGDDRYGQDATVEIVAAGYNGGPGAANSLYKGQGLTATETVVYSRDAFNMWRERAAANSPTYARWLERGGQKLIDVAAA